MGTQFDPTGSYQPANTQTPSASFDPSASYAPAASESDAVANRPDANAQAKSALPQPQYENAPNPRATVAKNFGDRIQAGQDAADQGQITSAGIGTGAFKAAGQTMHTVAALGTHALNTVAPGSVSQVPFAEPKSTQPLNTSESIGAVGENAAEWLAGEALTKGLIKATELPKYIAMLDKSPRAVRVLSKIMGASATVGAGSAAQAAAHGGDPVSAGVTGAITGGVLHGASQVAEAVAPKIFGGGKLRIRASDNSLHDLPAENLHRALARDPGLKVVNPTGEIALADAAPNAQPLQKAGRAVQADAAATKNAVGANLGAAKSAAASSLPADATGATVSMSLTPTSKSVVKANEILQSFASGSKLGLQDSGMADVQELAQKLATGKDAAGKVLTFTADDLDAANRTLGDKISSVEKAVKVGNANGSTLGQLKQLKSALNEDAFTFFEKNGDPQAAQSMRQLSKEYAVIAGAQTRGPAKIFFGNNATNSPEKVVLQILTAPEGKQSAVQDLVKQLSPEATETLRDSTTQQLFKSSPAEDGNVDMVKVQAKLQKMGATANALYGDRLPKLQGLVDVMADLQKSKNTPTLATTVKNAVTHTATKTATTGAGALVGGVPGAVAGSIVGEGISDIAIGKSGAVKIGISPTEKITIAPRFLRNLQMLDKLKQFASLTKPAARALLFSSIENAVRDDSDDSSSQNGQNQPTHHYNTATGKIEAIN